MSNVNQRQQLSFCEWRREGCGGRVVHLLDSQGLFCFYLSALPPLVSGPHHPVDRAWLSVGDSKLLLDSVASLPRPGRKCVYFALENPSSHVLQSLS